MGALADGRIDVVFSKWVVNEHRYTGTGIYAGDKPDDWLRTIAWLPQEGPLPVRDGPLDRN